MTEQEAGRRVTRPERVRNLVALCRWALQTLQRQPSGCDHEPPCFYRVDGDTMLRLRNRLARAVELADEDHTIPDPRDAEIERLQGVLAQIEGLCDPGIECVRCDEAHWIADAALSALSTTDVAEEKR